RIFDNAQDDSHLQAQFHKVIKMVEDSCWRNAREVLFEDNITEHQFQIDGKSVLLQCCDGEFQFAKNSYTYPIYTFNKIKGPDIKLNELGAAALNYLANRQDITLQSHYRVFVNYFDDVHFSHCLSHHEQHDNVLDVADIISFRPPTSKGLAIIKLSKTKRFTIDSSGAQQQKRTTIFDYRLTLNDTWNEHNGYFLYGDSLANLDVEKVLQSKTADEFVSYIHDYVNHHANDKVKDRFTKFLDEALTQAKDHTLKLKLETELLEQPKESIKKHKI
ncbi:MAG TPA: hypothetical protein VM577_00990, partial [Anaerovoracaceae bacterium]|nr:hypothetical protein [Anaerovoracaceae bacterium]